ncbi:MAG: outer membrane protein assembly factor BamD [Planctomycetota bacterium]|jgi:tetratricopeptide (TPR) repeat protein
MRVACTCRAGRRLADGTAGPLRRATLVLALSLAAACTGPALGDPLTALDRVRAHAEAGDVDDTAALGGMVVASRDISAEDRAEAAFLAGEAEMQLGRHGRAFERYRYVLENAPWSAHALEIEGRLYEIGEVMLFSDEYDGFFSDRGRGVDALETLAAHYRVSDRADDALKLVGDYFASEDVEEWGEAALSYLRVAEEYPQSEWAERCLWLAGHCRMEIAQGPQYDRNSLLRARELLQRSIETHPRGVAIADARADLQTVLDQLAECEIIVAEFYAARGVPVGEQLRLANAALGYPDTPAGRWARDRLLAMGVDPAALAGDPAAHSLDAIRSVRPLWEQQRAGSRASAGTGVTP